GRGEEKSAAFLLVHEVEVLVSDEDDVGHAEEQAGSEHARNGLDLRLQGARIGDRLHLAVKDVAMVVGEGRLAVLRPQDRLAAQLAELLLAERPRERRHLDGQLAARAQRRHALLLSRSIAEGDHELLRCGSDYLFADQRPAPTLDEVEVVIALVSAIHADVDAAGVDSGTQLQQRDTKLASQAVGGLRGRHAANLQSALDTPAKQLDELRRGAARAEADDHAVVDD